MLSSLFFCVNFVACVILVYPKGACAQQAGSHDGAPTTQPAAASHAGSRPEVELTILGQIGDIKGMNWPSDAGFRAHLDISAHVEEPAKLTVHFPHGKTIEMQTRPILVVTRGLSGHDRDRIVEVHAPPDGTARPLAASVQEVEKLLTAWGAVPSDHMAALLNDMKAWPNSGVGHIELTPMTGPVLEGASGKPQGNANPPADPIFSALGGSPQPRTLRVGAAEIDDRSEVTFELSSDRTGRWSVVAVFSSKEVEGASSRPDGDKQKPGATRPAG